MNKHTKNLVEPSVTTEGKVLKHINDSQKNIKKNNLIGEILNKLNKFKNKYTTLVLSFSLVFGSLVLFQVINPAINNVNVQAVATPLVNVILPVAGVNIGENFTFTASFDNSGNTPGFGPFIDLIIPASGLDGDDGINVSSPATYLGQPIPTTILIFPSSVIGINPCSVGLFPLSHPFSLNSAGVNETICGKSGDKLVIAALPFGSFVPDQPPAVLTFNASVSNLADAASPLTIRSRGGFMYGNDVLNNYNTDPVITSNFANSSITPQVFTVTKAYQGVENETATGPNFKRRYSMRANIAAGQSISNLVLTDNLPPSAVFSGFISANPNTGSVTTSPSTTSPNNAPNNQFVYTYPSIVGTTGAIDAEVIFEYYIAGENASGASVINPTSGDSTVSNNDVLGSGTWTPIDTRDASQNFVSNPSAVDHVLTNNSISLQKSVANVSAGAIHAGSVLEYTLNFQVSDYFAFDNIVITDLLGDGQLIDTSFLPRMTLREQGSLLASNTNFSPSNYSVNKDTLTNGISTVIFNISDQLISNGFNSNLQGGCVPGGIAANCVTNNSGATFGSIVFRSIVQQNFTNTGVDLSVDILDSIVNNTTIAGNVLDNISLLPTGQSDSNNSGTSVTIAAGGVQKEVYAVNGSTTIPSPLYISPGDVLTYRIRYDIPVTDFEDLVLGDYLPLPVFSSAGFSTVFNPTISSAIPPANTAKYGPSETLFAITGNTPSVAINNAENLVSFDFNSFDDALDRSAQIDILLSVEASSAPFADGLNIMNQVSAKISNTGKVSTSSDAIAPVVLALPNLNLQKGVVASSNVSGITTMDVNNVVSTTPAPVSFSNNSTACTGLDHRFTGTINSTNIATTPITKDIVNLDSGDIVTFALTVENKGRANRGAYDVTLKDTIPAGFVVPSDGLNVCATNGAGSVIGFSPVNSLETNPFINSGIILNDGVGVGSTGSIPKYDPLNPSSGENLAIITYQLQVAPNIAPKTTIENSASLLGYASVNSGVNFLSIPLSDVATVRTADLRLAKTFTSTNITESLNNDVYIGETVNYSIDVTVPEGRSDSLIITDLLDNGLVFKEITSISASAGLSSTLATPINSSTFLPTITNNGRSLSLNFGNVTNSNTDNFVQERITINYSVVVANLAAAVNNTQLNNEARVSYNNGTVQTLTSVSANNVVVKEPALTISKTVTPTSSDALNDATYTITISNPSATSGANAYNVVLADVLPSYITYVPGFDVVTGTAPTSITINASGVNATFNALNLTQTTTISFRVNLNQSIFPTQVITNIANLKYSSLPGIVNTTQSTFSPVAVERTGTTTDLGGALNTYNLNSSANITVTNVVAAKTVTATSETATTINAGVERVAVGEVVRYRLVTTIPESTINNLRIRDNLPNGMQFLNDGTAMIAFVSNGSTTTSVGGFGSCFVIGSLATVVPSCVIPSAQITGGAFADGTDPTFNLGNLVNADNDANSEFIIIEFNAIVTNNNINQAFNNASGAVSNSSLVNNYSVIGVNPITSLDSTMITSGNVSVNIVEPVLSVSSTLTTTPIDQGDTGILRLVVTNTATGNNASPAFDNNLLNNLPSGLTINSINFVANPVYLTTVNNSTSTSANIDFNRLNPGDSFTVDINFTVNTSFNGQNFPLNSGVTYTSLQLAGNTSNPTGSNSTLERNGTNSPVVNDYRRTSATSFTTNAGSVDKTLEGSQTQYRIGDEVVYNIKATLSEGQNNNLRVTEVLPTNLEYLSHTVITLASGSSLLSSDFSSPLSTPTVTTPAGEVIFNFGNTPLSNDNVLTNNSFIIRIVTRVRDVVANQNLTNIANTANLKTLNTVTNTDTLISDPSPVVVQSIIPILGLTKNFSQTVVSANQTVNITLVARNTGNATAYNYTLTDNIDLTKFENLTIVSSPSSSTGNISPTGVITFTGPAINSGDILTFVISAKTLLSLPNNTVVNNTATLSGTSTLNGNFTYDRDLPTINANDNLNIHTPDIQIIKSSNLNVIAPSGTMIYSLLVSNNGLVNASGVKVFETLPQYTSFNSGSSTAGWVNTSGINYELLVGNLNAGQSITYFFAVNLNQSVPESVENLSNTATVADDGTRGTDFNTGNNSSTDIDPINATPDLQLTIDDGITTTSTNNSLTYTVTVRNVGNQTATNSVININLPNNTTYTSNPNGGTVTGNVLTYPNFNINAGDTVTYTFTVQTNPTLPSGVTLITTNGTVADDGTNGTDPTPANNLATDTDTINAAPDLQITKTDSGATITPDGEITYTINYNNTGNQNATGVIITETVPANTTYISLGSSAFSCANNSPSGTTCTFNVGNLNVNNPGSLTFKVKVNSTIPSSITEINNTIRIADDGANGTDPTPLNNEAVEVTPLTAAPDLEILKTDNVLIATPNTDLIYDLTVKNNGNQEAISIVITETVPANTTFNNLLSTAGWNLISGTGNAGSVYTFNISSILGQSTNPVIKFAVKVNANIPSSITEVVNTVTVIDNLLNGADPTPENNEAADTDNLIASPDLRVTIDDSLTTVNPDDTVTYTLNYSNTGNQDATGSVINSSLDPNVAYVTSSNGGSVVGNNVVWSIGNIAAGASGSVTFTVKLNSSFASGVNTIVSNATIADDGTNGTDPTPANNSSSDTDVLDANPDLFVNITDNGVTVTTGQDITYAIDYGNIGYQNSQNAKIDFTVPLNTSFNSNLLANTGYTCTGVVISAGIYNAGSVCILNVGGVNVSSTNNSTIILTTNTTLPAGVENINLSVNISDDGVNGVDLNLLNNTDSEITPITATPDLQLTIDDGITTTSTNNSLTYTVTVRNVGNQTATNSVININLPNNTTYTSNPNGGTVTGNVLTYPNFNINAGDTLTYTFTVQTNPTLPSGVTLITTNGTVADDGTNGTDPTPANNLATDTDTINAAPDLQITKTDSGATITPDGEITYTINYNNTGNQNATGVIITETVPANTTYISLGSSAFSCANNSPSGTTCTFNVGNLNVNNPGSLTFKVKVNSTIPSSITEINNTIRIADDGANGTDPTPLNNEAVEVTTLDALPDLVITETDNGVNAIPNSPYTYVIDYLNSGNQTATGVVITHQIPQETTFVPANSTAGWVCTSNVYPGTCTINIGTLDSGETGSINFTVQVAETVSQNLFNINHSVSIADDGLNGVEPNLTNNQDTEVTPVIATTNLTLTKTDNKTAISNNDKTTFVLTLTNLGDRRAENVTLEDEFDSIYAYEPSNLITPSNYAIINPTQINWTNINLDKNQSFIANLELTLLISPPIPAGLETVQNVARVESYSLTATDVNSITALPELSITKTDNTTTIETGNINVYNIVATNTGNQNASGVIITENIPANTQFVPSSSTVGWNCNLTSNICSYSIPLLSVNEVVNLQFALSLTIPVTVETVTNIVSIQDDGVSGIETNTLNNTSTDTDNTLGKPNLVITKTDSLATIVPGQSVTYTITVQNTGDIFAKGVRITDTLSPLYTFVSASNGGVLNPSATPLTTPSTISFPLIDIPSGQTLTYTIVVNLAEVVDVNVEEITNKANVELTNLDFGTETSLTDNEAIDTDIINANPDLKITTKILNDDIYPTEIVDAEFTYSNIGNQNSSNVIITFTIPNNTTFDPLINVGLNTNFPNLSWQCDKFTSGGVCSVNLGNVNVNDGERSIRIKFTNIEDFDEENFDFILLGKIADDETNGFEVTMENNASPDQKKIKQINLEIIKLVDKSEAFVQEELTYKFIYRNLGPDNATNVVLTEILPSDLEFVSAELNNVLITTTSAKNADGTTTLLFNIPLIEADGIDKFLSVKTKIIKPIAGEIVNEISIRARESDPEISNNRSIISVKVKELIPAVKNPNFIGLPRTGAAVNKVFISVLLLFTCGIALYSYIKFIKYKNSNKKSKR